MSVFEYVTCVCGSSAAFICGIILLSASYSRVLQYNCERRGYLCVAWREESSIQLPGENTDMGARKWTSPTSSGM